MPGPPARPRVRGALPQQAADGGVGDAGGLACFHGGGALVHQLQGSHQVCLAVALVARQRASPRRRATTRVVIPWNRAPGKLCLSFDHVLLPRSRHRISVYDRSHVVVVVVNLV